MADSKVVRLLKIIQHETGKDILSNLDKKRLSLLEGYYNSLTEDQQEDIDEKIISGEDNDFAEVAEGMAFGMINGEVAFSKKSSTATAEPPSSSALAIIPKPEKEETDLVDEDIDPLILRLLGFGDVFDIDYDTYKTLLREKMVAGRMPDSKMPTEEIELLTNEFKRVKGKTGRFKVKSQKIRAESFVAKKKQPTTTKSVKALPGVKGPKPPQIKPAPEPDDQVSETMKLMASKIADVNNNVKKIVDTNLKKDKVEKKQEEKQRIAGDRTRKVIREERAERGRMASGLINGLGAAIAPVKGVLDIIGDFLKRFLIGTAIMELLKFLENPQAYINGIVNWMNGVIAKIEDGIRSIVKDIIIAPINKIVDGVNSGIKYMVDQVNGLIDKIPGNIIPKIDPEKMKISTVDPSIVDNIVSLPRIPMFGGESSQAKQTGQLQQQGQTSQGSSGISQNARALLNTIRYAEGTSGPQGYNTWFGGRTDMDLSKMTINEVVLEQKRRIASGEATYGKYTSAAVGAYQMMKPEVFARKAGIDPATTKFTPEIQDKLAIAGYMKGQAGMTQAEIDAPISRQQIAKLAPVWASLPMMSGRSRYGQPVKKYSDLERKYNQYLNQSQQQQISSSQKQKVGGSTISSTTTTASSSSATIAAKKPNVPPPAAPGSAGLTALPIPVQTGAQQNNQTSVSVPNQKSVPKFSAYDRTNQNYLVIKSIYNIVG